MLRSTAFLLLFAAQANATDYTCSLQKSCMNTQPCKAVDLEVKFSVTDKIKDPADPLTPPQSSESFRIQVSGLEEEFEAFGFGDEAGPVVGFFGHMRINEQILDEGYFWGKGHEQHVFTFANGTARYSIHKPLKNQALYLEGNCIATPSK